jgi:aspartate racemase
VFFTGKIVVEGVATEEQLQRSNFIFNEMAKGIFSSETKAAYLSIIDKMTAQGAEVIIFGCTEIPLLIKPEECTIPVFDTTLIHANAAVRFAVDL